MFNLKTKYIVTPELHHQYISLCERVSALLATTGKTVPPYADSDVPRLHAHSDPKRVVSTLGIYADVLQQAVNADESLNDDKRLVWRMIQKMGYRFNSDLMDNIHDEDTIEIYTTDDWQIFRNLRFFDYLDCTVDEISTLVWSRDSERDMSVTMEALRLIFLIKTGMLKETFKVTSLKKHTVTCFFSGKKQKFSVSHRIASPLRGPQGLVAFLITHRTEKIPVN